MFHDAFTVPAQALLLTSVSERSLGNCWGFFQEPSQVNMVVTRSKRYDSFYFGSNQVILAKIETVSHSAKRYDLLPVLLLVAMRFDSQRGGYHYTRSSWQGMVIRLSS